nr:cytochrome b/b6 domain-containing protein [Bradyrhizobium aeschynomenes]
MPRRISERSRSRASARPRCSAGSRRAGGVSWEAFEPPVDAIHHFVGKWIAWVVVGLHIAAALFHHLVRRDGVLTRMLPGRGSA